MDMLRRLFPASAAAIVAAGVLATAPNAAQAQAYPLYDRGTYGYTSPYADPGYGVPDGFDASAGYGGLGAGYGGIGDVGVWGDGALYNDEGVFGDTGFYTDYTRYYGTEFEDEGWFDWW